MSLKAPPPDVAPRTPHEEGDGAQKRKNPPNVNTYSAVLTYNPNDKSITISQVKLLTEDAEAGTFVADGMKFTK